MFFFKLHDINLIGLDVNLYTRQHDDKIKKNKDQIRKIYKNIGFLNFIEKEDEYMSCQKN